MSEHLKKLPPRPQKLRGLEILFALEPPNKPTDVIVMTVHWRLITEGFFCLGTDDGTEIPQIDENTVYSELLPHNWNVPWELDDRPQMYEFIYVSPKDELITLRAVKAEELLYVSFLNRKTKKVCSSTIPINKYVTSEYANFRRVFNDVESLLQHIETEIVRPLNPAEKEKSINLREVSTALDEDDCAGQFEGNRMPPMYPGAMPPMPGSGSDPLRVPHRMPPFRYDPLGPPLPDDLMPRRGNRNTHPDLPPMPDFEDHFF